MNFSISTLYVIVFSLIWITTKMAEMPPPPGPNTTPIPDRHNPPTKPMRG